MRPIFLILLCLISSIFQAQAASTSDIEPYRVTSSEKHDMRVINSGLGSLYARVDMIRRAKKSIDLETFIFNPDTAGKIILQELAAAVKRGVKVRILLDKSPSQWKMTENYAKVIKAQGIDIRYYNNSSILSPSSVQFRNHRKLMVRDGEEVITGGRNIADEYFDLSKKFNFLDRDVTVEGEVVKSMDKTFENFWNSKLVIEPKYPEKPYPLASDDNETEYKSQLYRYEQGEKAAAKLFTPDDETTKTLQRLMLTGQANFNENAKRECPEVSFATDREGASFKESLNNEEYSRKYRLLRQEIAKWMDEKIKGEVILDTPYFLENSMSEKLISALQTKKAKVKLFTNSLASTDAIHVSTVFGDTVMNYTPFEDFRAYVYKGNYSNETKLDDEDVKKATWGTHSKSMVFSSDSFMIGSFNFDNRSSYYNTELAVFCSGSPELTKDITVNIQKRVDNSFKLDTNGDPECNDLVQPEVGALKKALYYIIKIPSHMFQHLL
jgi:putative cardiolipin synthase